MRALVAMTLVACGSPEPATCDGGGELALEIGAGGRDAFVPYSEGDAIRRAGDAVALELWSSGLDTTAPVNGVVRITSTGGSRDGIASLTLLCGEPGHGWTSVQAFLPDDAGPGSAITVRAVLTDARGISASHELAAVVGD